MSLVLNPTLTNFARGIAGDFESGSLANFLAPDCLVAAGTGNFKKFDDAAAFEIEDTERALGTDPNIISLTSSDATYNCKPHALEARIDKKERDDYGEGDPLGIERVKTKVLVTRARKAWEARVIAKANTLSAVGGVGVWSSADNDPIKEIDAQIEAIATTSDMLPNRLAIGLPAWNVIRNHPKVIARFPGAAQVGVTLAQFASLLLNPGIEIKLGTLGRNTNRQGASKAITNMMGSQLFVFIGQNAPTEFDPSFMKTFRTRSGGVDSVRTYTAQNGLYDGLIVDWTEDIQVIGTATARRISLS